MRVIQEKCVEYDSERKLSIIVEYIAGKVTQTIDRLIALYRPDSVVVGTRGQRSVMQAWAGAFGAPGVGSVSKSVKSLSLPPLTSRTRDTERVRPQILSEPLARTRHRHPPREQSPQDDGETTRGSQTRPALRHVSRVLDPLLPPFPPIRPSMRKRCLQHLMPPLPLARIG